jgi:hypothetical protein
MFDTDFLGTACSGRKSVCDTISLIYKCSRFLLLKLVMYEPSLVPYGSWCQESFFFIDKLSMCMWFCFLELCCQSQWCRRIS